MSLLQTNFTSIYAPVSLMKLLAVHTSHLSKTITEAIEKETMKTMKVIMKAIKEEIMKKRL